MLIKLFEDKSEKKSLEVKAHPSRSIYADEAGMEWNVREHSFRARRILLPTEILAVPGDEDPILVEQDFL